MQGREGAPTSLGVHRWRHRPHAPPSTTVQRHERTSSGRAPRLGAPPRPCLPDSPCAPPTDCRRPTREGAAPAPPYLHAQTGRAATRPQHGGRWGRPHGSTPRPEGGIHPGHCRGKPSGGTGRGRPRAAAAARRGLQTAVGRARCSAQRGYVQPSATMMPPLPSHSPHQKPVFHSPPLHLPPLFTPFLPAAPVPIVRHH